MSDQENTEFVPGPIDLSAESPKPEAKPKRTYTRRKKTDAADAPASSEVSETEVKKPASKKRAAAKKKTSTAKTKNVDASKTSAASEKSDNQRTLLFSSDDESSDDSGKKESPDDHGSETNANEASAQKDADTEGDTRKQNSGGGNREPRSFNKGQGPKGNFKGKGGNNNRQQNLQQGLSNRKKKQQQWKQKQKQKKGNKDRFKIDGLNADIDNALELGNLTEWDKLQSEETFKEYLAELPEVKADSVFNFGEIYTLPLDQLREAATATGEEMPPAPNRKQLIELILSHANKEGKTLEVTGVLEVLADGNGLLTYSSDSYRLRAHSSFVPAFFIKKYGLLRGHEIKCRVLPPVEEATCLLVAEIKEVQGMDPEKANEIEPFTEQIPYYPTTRCFLENDKQEDANKVSMRVVDLISPIGFGQRGLIVAPPRTGKTILLQGMANAVQNNYPDAHLIILLIDERPEEVTDFRRRVTGGEVISSTFDENAESHVHAAEMVIEKSRRMVEAGKDVVILLDSITRLARAYNTVMPNSGKILSGGVEANALQKPKRFFGSARNIEGGGSLTIIATALVETGSKMDEVIFEEFKGTGNMELHLDRALVDKRVFPALSMEKSGTRKEELLYHPDELQKIYGLRRAMKGVPSTEAMEMLIMKVKKTGSNAEFLMTAAR